MKTKVSARIKTIFNTPDDTEAKRLLDIFINDYQESAPKLVQWAETALPEGLVYFLFPEKHRKKIRTVNMLERINREIRRRTRVVLLFYTDSCLRLVSVVTMEISEDWQTGKRYLIMNNSSFAGAPEGR